jgi:hypothetical protein
MAVSCPFCRAAGEFVEWDEVLRLWVCMVCARRWRIMRVAFAK